MVRVMVVDRSLLCPKWNVSFMFDVNDTNDK